jgi:hypothetical protein
MPPEDRTPEVEDGDPTALLAPRIESTTQEGEQRDFLVTFRRSVKTPEDPSVHRENQVVLVAKRVSGRSVGAALELARYEAERDDHSWVRQATVACRVARQTDIPGVRIATVTCVCASCQENARILEVGRLALAEAQRQLHLRIAALRDREKRYQRNMDLEG